MGILDHLFDSYDIEQSLEYPDPESKTCNRCGMYPLHWLPIVDAHGRTRYWLHDERNRRHVCMPDPNDFGVVPEEEPG